MYKVTIFLNCFSKPEICLRIWNEIFSLFFRDYGMSIIILRWIWHDLHSSFFGSRPSFFIDSSPNGLEIQVLLRTKHVKERPSTFWRLGTIWIELEPPPMIPTRLCLKSYSWFQAAECITSPLKFSNPGMVGQALSFKFPLAWITISASSSNISPVWVFSTVNLLVISQNLSS